MEFLSNIFGGSPAIGIAAVLCGIALLYLVVARTMKKRSDEQ